MRLQGSPTTWAKVQVMKLARVFDRNIAQETRSYFAAPFNGQ